MDPSSLFNFRFNGKVRRTVDIHEGDKTNETTLKTLILKAVALMIKGEK